MNTLLLRRFWHLALAVLVIALAGCASRPHTPAPQPQPGIPEQPRTGLFGLDEFLMSDDTGVLPAPMMQGKSRWVPVRWAELPGLRGDALNEAWNAWIQSCERPHPNLAYLCNEVRRLSLADPEEQRGWLRARLQPYRVESLNGAGDGMLTGYFEPLFDARRYPTPGFTVPVYRAPANLRSRTPWYTRKEIDTLPEARAALRGREIVWLSDATDVLIMQIQGSGRIRVTEPDGSIHMVRMAYAGTYGQPYQSVGRWLLDHNEVQDASWPGIKEWIAKNPHRTQELLWVNPRVVFFQEEPLTTQDAAFGPRGAQGVPLTPGRSIAVDPASVPYGTPVWIDSRGPLLDLQRLVMAQDTGSAITGAVRADYFAGWGAEAGDLAGRLKQSLRMWVLWPKVHRGD